MSDSTLPTTPPPVPPSRHGRHVATVPGWWSTVQEAERATLRVVSRDDIVSACTHALDGIAVATVELMPGIDSPWARHESPPGRIGHLAELAHENRWSGRAFVFPGQSRLTERMTVGHLLRESAVDAVVLPGGGGECPLTTVVVGAPEARPLYRDGRLVLLVRPGTGGTVAPFERRPPEVVSPETPHLQG